MSIDIKPLSITSMFNNIKSFFQSQENNSKWRDLSTGAEGIFFIRMLANVLSVLSSRIITGRREQFHDTANFMSSQIALAVNNGYSVYRGRNHRRRIRLPLHGQLNWTIPALSVVGFYDDEHAIITLDEINPSKNILEEDEIKTIEFTAVIGALKEITWQPKTSELKKFVRHEQGISEDYQLFLDGNLLPTSKVAKDKLKDMYYVYTNHYKSVTIEYLNNLPTATHKYDNDSTFTLRYVELADMDMEELTLDMFTIENTAELTDTEAFYFSEVILSSYKGFEDIDSIKQNSPIYRELQNIIRSKEDWKDAYKNALPVVKEVTYRALTPTYTQLSYIKSDHTLIEASYNDSMDRITDIEEGSIRETLEPSRYFGRPFPDLEDPKREVTTFDVTLGLINARKYENDIKKDVQNIINNALVDKFGQATNIYDLEQALKELTYVKYARVSIHAPKRENFTEYRKGDVVVEDVDYGMNEIIEKTYRCKEVLGQSSAEEPIWNVPGFSENIETGYITVDNELIWQCYKKLANMQDLAVWNYSSYYAVGDFIETPTYPNHVFKCISLIAQSAPVEPDVSAVVEGDYVEDGKLLLVCIPYSGTKYEERVNKGKYKLRDRFNLSGLSFEVVGFIGTSSGASAIKIRSEEQPLFAIPIEAREAIKDGLLYMDGDFRNYVKQGDMVQVSVKLAKNTPYEEIIEDDVTPSAIISAEVKEYEDEDTGADEDDFEQESVINSNTTINIDFSNSILSAYGLSSRKAPSTEGLVVDDLIDDYQLQLICIPYDSTLNLRQNAKRYKALDKFNIAGCTSVSFQVVTLQSAGLSAEAEPYILTKNIGDTVEDYQLLETIVEYDSSYPERQNFTEYAKGAFINIPGITDKSLQVTGLTDAGVDFDEVASNPGSVDREDTETEVPGNPTDPDEPKEDEKPVQNANWKELEAMKDKMEYVQSWITSEVNDSLHTPADVIAFYRTLGDGSRFTAEELEQLISYYNEYKQEDEDQIYLHMDQFNSTRLEAIKELVDAKQLPDKPLIDINCVKYYNADNELVYIDRYGSATIQEDGTIVFLADYEPLSPEYAIQREDANGNVIKVISIGTDDDGNPIVKETYNKVFATTVLSVTYSPYPNPYVDRYLTNIEIATPVGYYMEGSTINFAYRTVVDGSILWEEVTDLENIEYGWNVFPNVEINIDVRS